MVPLIFIILAVVVVWAMGANAKRRQAEARLRLLAAYSAGLQDAHSMQETVATIEVEPPTERPSFAGQRVAPMAESRRLGYWGHPPCPIADDLAVQARLTALQGSAPEICFTGFGEADEEHLKTVATETGFRVRTAVTKRLTFLCAGEGPGPVKLQKAAAQKCLVISAEQFSQLAYCGWETP